RSAYRQPQKIRCCDAKCHDQTVGLAELQHTPAKSWRIDGGEVKCDGRHRDDHHAERNNPAIFKHRCKNFPRAWMVLTGKKVRRFCQGAAKQEDEGDDGTANKEWDAPAPLSTCFRREADAKSVTDKGGHEYSDLLAG